ncbi:MAG: ribosome-associated translation inhibitor RaiA [Candidatus Eisenbacteria bacterium]|uniref:Ribosome-associated translation inhibitor RaiA n=1 Tax=Eiseniibacteriota bacterium TaxID=2212470 RepID=A0A948W2D3_UNCEI|nr:ribosome-associated translation inhibitor RaiA [Candidatus Eisenbacteria bacterium]MBU1948976.1 ribosome-associated translation inhibitor RaiA [Candidatus Eisenbacteria bacterium]MBU2689827.1 ribosome-associated translation inhibitor RaiA [Candidatus Eisenbacteria bacterium]
MDIITTARHTELTPEIREHAEKRLRKLERYVSDLQEVHLIINKEKYRHVAEVTLRAKGTNIVSSDESSDLLTSIDRVVDRVERQVKKIRARLKDRGKARRQSSRRVMTSAEPGFVEEEEPVDEVQEDESYPPVVVPRQEIFRTEPTTVSKAVDELRLQEEDVLLFRNEKTGVVSLVYMRPDGNVGFAEAL